MLSEINQTQKGKYCMIPNILQEGPRIDKFTETDSRIELTRDWREGRIDNDQLTVTEFCDHCPSQGMMEKF